MQRKLRGFMHAKPNKRKQGGYIASLAIVLAVIGIIMYGYARQQVIAGNRAAGASMGRSFDQVSNALTRFRKDKFLALTSATTGTPAVVAGVANAVAPTVAELKALGYLDASTSTTLLGNTYQTGIFKNPSGCVGPSTTCDVYSVLWLTNPVVDSVTLKPNITKLAALVGAVTDSASYSALPNLAVIVGNAGGWTIPNPDSAQRAGIVASVSGLGGNYPAFLQVGDPRDPAFTGNATVAGYIKPSAGPGQTVVQGDSCATVPAGAMKSDATGRVLSCQNNIWKATDGSNTAITIAPLNNVVGGTTFAVVPCAVGGTPWATYSAQLSAINVALIPPVIVVEYSVSQVGSNWVTLTQAVRPPSAPVTINNTTGGGILGAIPRGVFIAGCRYPG